MAGRGMGAATQGGGAVRSGPRNKVLKTRSKTTGIPMYAEGGNVKKPGKGAMSAKDILKKAAPKGAMSAKDIAKDILKKAAPKKPGKGAMSAKDIAILKKGFKKAAPKKAKPVKKNRGGMMYR